MTHNVLGLNVFAFGAIATLIAFNFLYLNPWAYLSLHILLRLEEFGTGRARSEINHNSFLYVSGCDNKEADNFGKTDCQSFNELSLINSKFSIFNCIVIM